ncbi:hypothetical protein ADUPG1_009665 [Aduncisulcus paluster]|uniref:Uncharacterized protein n=1 Tax=Aduncisulcus paluster TaxID=2918883 RepID=A0ABQ5KZ63_9EUKA|nr:hypothetical protein ADUPG1_009665 [Aduncisulcus paluster]
MSCSSSSIQSVKPECIIDSTSWNFRPIPFDSPNIRSPEFLSVKARNETKKEGQVGYDRSFDAQNMMKGEWNNGHFTYISIPFSFASPMKGAYIYLTSVCHLTFTFTSIKGDKTSKKYDFAEFIGKHWYFLPVDLPDVVLCEITGKGSDKEYFRIETLIFFREETPEEILARVAKEKLWTEAEVVKPEFIWEGEKRSDGRKPVPIPRDDPMVINPSLSIVKCKDDTYSKESRWYDRSFNAQKMLKGEDFVYLSHLSIPFPPSYSSMKGAYICVDIFNSSPALLFTFTLSDGKKTSKKYEFPKPKYRFAWYFLPIFLLNVLLCEIEGKGTWRCKNCPYFYIFSLVFTKSEEYLISEQLSLLPWK